MNIVIKTYDGGTYCRPDTTWERENRDFYSPDSVSTIYWVPVVFTKVSRAGKSIGKKFASRYYDAMNFGIMLYIGDLMPDRASASCADHTSILPFPLYNRVVFDGTDNIFTVMRNGECIFESGTEGMIDRLENALCSSSIMTSLRTGDVEAVELQSPELLCSRTNEELYIEATFCNNPLFDFRVIF